ncbi:hypothetical protein IscW_ISCW011494 [Ixodes scapularis]|uniref:Uncharacterized protein n=1 Tax=Ixodes scapularis TaxID=6945 RepID=B7Q798_IXOSC|nr:hypothetical protein IscW_ISCW011494 [Ixodes scapularis]|eukprot:XP_002412136.1 hypothetical protein IscW_ISCW011494 [Ixodes scapularis]
MFSPLHSAAQAGRPDFLLRSLQTGADPNLQLALCLGQLSAATLLNSAHQLGVEPPQAHRAPILSSRKRCHGGFRCAQEAKRCRIADDEAMSEDCLLDCKPVPLLHGEETLLHRVEQGYNRVFIESWLSEVHGC